MAFVDNQLLLSDAQALSSTAASTNLIDFTKSRRMGAGEPMAIVVGLDVAADRTTGDETYSIAVQVDDDSAFGSATTVATYALSTYALGDVHVIALPITSVNSDNRYLRVNYTLGGTTPSVTVTTFLTPLSSAPQKYIPFAGGFTIS